MKTITFTNIGRLMFWFGGMQPNVNFHVEQVTTMVDIADHVKNVEFDTPVRHGFVITLDVPLEPVINAIKKDLGGHSFAFEKMDGVDAYNCIIGDTYFVIRKEEKHEQYSFESSVCSKLTNIAVPYQMSAKRLMYLSKCIRLKEVTAFKLFLLADIILGDDNSQTNVDPVHQEKISAIKALMVAQSDKQNLLEDLGKFVTSKEINDFIN